MLKEFTVTPNKNAFLYYPLIKTAVVLPIILLVVFTLVNGVLALMKVSRRVSIIYFLIIFLLIYVSTIISKSAKYRKTKYIFYKNRIIEKGGSLFSDYEIDLSIKNITNIKVTIPFLENKLFGTGSLDVQSAGSGQTSIFLESINHSEDLYKYTEELLRGNGFKLTKKQLIQEESPQPLGALFEIGKEALKTLIWVFFLIIYAIAGFSGAKGAGIKVPDYVYIGILVMIIVIIGISLSFIFKYLDLVRRKYKVYNDAITYTEGFLSKHYAYMPIENLADSETTQTFVDRVLGLYDVKISCQGSGQEIIFKNMANGEKLEKNIDAIIAKTTSLISKDRIISKEIISEEKISTASRKVESVKINTTNNKSNSHYNNNNVKDNNLFTAEFKMETSRALFTSFLVLPIFLVFFPLLVYWIAYFVMLIIRLYGTTYYVKKNSIEEKFKAFSARSKEYTIDKITSIVVKESFIDKWFSTVQLEFKSIGSFGVISFNHIKKDEKIIAEILAKFGIKEQPLLTEMHSEFNFAEMLKAHLINTFGGIMVISGIIIAGILFHPLYFFLLIAYSIYLLFIVWYKGEYYKSSTVKFFKDFIYLKKGLLFKEQYFVLYKNIKNITITQYPFSDHGSLKFNIAGESAGDVDSYNGKHRFVLSNDVQIDFITKIQEKDELVDIIFYKMPNEQQVKKIERAVQTLKEKPLLYKKPALANSLIPAVFWLALLSAIVIASVGYFHAAIQNKIIFTINMQIPIIIPILLVVIFDVLVILLVILEVNAKSYAIESYRVVAKSGILYRTQLSIIFNRIDYLNTYEGMLNKMFKNGTVTVNTAGSRAPELVIKNISEYKQFYDEVKKRYGN